MRITRLSLVKLAILGFTIVLGFFTLTIVDATPYLPPPAAQPPQSLAHVQNVGNVEKGGWGIKSTLSGIPAFTSSDVIRFISTHSSPLGPTTTGMPPTIVSIEFITSKQASQRLLGEWIGVPDTAIVCYVKLYGPFTNSDVPSPPGAIIKPSNTATEIFDAQTGNLLVVSTR